MIQLVGKSQLGRLGRCAKISFVYIHLVGFTTFFCLVETIEIVVNDLTLFNYDFYG
jgi:hypothetical protein